MRSSGALFERAPHVNALSAFDFIPKHVVPNTEVVASPTDDSRPSDLVEKSTARSAPSCASHPPSDDPRKGPQEGLKGLAPPGTNEQVQVGPHVGKVVNPDPEATGHRPKRVA